MQQSMSRSGLRSAQAASVPSGDEVPEGTPGSSEDTCPRCGGTGRLGDLPCNDCNGTGVINVNLGDA
ncbi:MAG: hypothetical protein JWQ72_1714 [Polaromonas sp.]|nr:hypothetical protein [Polaromonas sp.]